MATRAKFFNIWISCIQCIQATINRIKWWQARSLTPSQRTTRPCNRKSISKEERNRSHTEPKRASRLVLCIMVERQINNNLHITLSLAEKCKAINLSRCSTHNSNKWLWSSILQAACRTTRESQEWRATIRLQTMAESRTFWARTWTPSIYRKPAPGQNSLKGPVKLEINWLIHSMLDTNSGLTMEIHPMHHRWCRWRRTCPVPQSWADKSPERLHRVSWSGEIIISNNFWISKSYHRCMETKRLQHKGGNLVRDNSRLSQGSK